MTSGSEAARAATRRDDLRRRLRGTSGRARKLRGLVVLLGPYRSRVVMMYVALVIGTAASLAPAPLAKAAIDSGILKGDEAAQLATAPGRAAQAPAQVLAPRRRARRLAAAAHSPAILRSRGLRVRNTWSGRPFSTISR